MMMRSMRRRKDLGIEGRTARWYNDNSRKHRLGEMREYADLLGKQLAPESHVLDLACGPGYLSIQLARSGHKVVGLDISRTFIGIARSNAAEAGVPVDFLLGNASALPFPDGSFDALVCTAAFKNFREPQTALAEMYRLLKPGGLALIIDMNRHATDEQIRELTRKMGLKGLEAMFLKMTFKYFLRKGAYTRGEVTAMLSGLGWKDTRIEEEGIGFYIWLKK